MFRNDDIINELNFCPTIYHAISLFKEKLLALNYTELKSDLEWPSPPPSNFFIIYKKKNIVVFKNKEKQKGTFLIGNMKPNLFRIEKNSKIPTFDYNFCRVLTSCSKYDNWSGRAMRIAGNVSIQNESSKEIKEINIYSKRLAGIFPSKQEIDFLRNSTDIDNSSNQKKLPIDIFLGLSRDCNPLINDFSGPIIKIISDELEVSPNLIQNPDLYLVDSNYSNFIGVSNENNNRIISGQNISQYCPPLLAFNSFLYSQQQSDVIERFTSFILFDENEPMDSSFNEFLSNLFQKIEITNDSLVLNIIPTKHEKIENIIFFDTTNKELEKIFTNNSECLSSKIHTHLQPKLIPIIHTISKEIVKIGIPVSNFECPRERTSLICLNFLIKLIDKILTNS